MNEATAPETRDEGATEVEAEAGHSFYPFHVIDTAIIAYVLGGVLVTLAVLLPFHLHEPADPLKSPHGIKPEWYFLPMYQVLKYLPPKVTVPWVSRAEEEADETDEIGLAAGEESVASSAEGAAEGEAERWPPVREVDISWLGVMISGAAFLAILIWPFVDALKGTWRRIHVGFLVVGIVLILLLVVGRSISWPWAALSVVGLVIVDFAICRATASPRFHVIVGAVAIAVALIFGILGHISERNVTVGGKHYHIDLKGVPHAIAPEEQPTPEP